MDTFLCPDQGTILRLQGKFSSDIFQYIKIGVKACTTTAGKTCASSAQIQQYLNTNEAFKLQFFYLNTIINSDNQDYLGTYMDTSTYFLFTPTYGAIGNFYISSYSITTDNSILPWEQKSIDEGGITDNGATEDKNYEVNKHVDYVKFYIRKSSLSLTYQRSFRKADDCLSYIGGLFSTLAALLFFLPKYNQACYELSVAQSSFHYEKNNPIKSEEFNFITFLGYLIYSLLDMVCITLQWEKMKRIDQCFQQIKKQMDIRLIMKKILYAERTTIAIFSQPKAKILHLQSPMTLSEVQQIRKNHRFYDKLEEKFFDYKKISKEQKLNEKQDIPVQDNKKQKQQQVKKIESQNENQNEAQQMNREKNPNIIVESLDKITQNKKGPQKIKKEKDQIQKKKTFAQIINKVFDDKAQKQKELEQMIEEMKENVEILQKDSQEGYLVSQKILDKLDPKLMKIVINHKERQNQQLLNTEQAGKPRKINSFQNGEYQFEDNPETHSQIKRDEL